MSALIGIIAPIFWFVVVVSFLVFVHEGGHFLAARACGVRVTEFFLGMPCRFNLSHVSKRIGTKFGVTPLLLGGYAMICGMEPFDDDLAPRALALVHRRGVMSVEDLARELGCDTDRALNICAALQGWGSLAPRYDEAKGERAGGAYLATTYAAMPRDSKGRTIYDGKSFARAEATIEGDAWEPPFSDDEFFARERSRTYVGVGFWKRAFMLIAGIVVNIVVGFMLMMSVYSIIGFSVAQDVNTVGSVEQGSLAEEIGLAPGDAIVSIDGSETDTWTDVYTALQEAAGSGEFELVFDHDGATETAVVNLDEGEMLGVGVSTELVRLNPIEAAQVSWSSIVLTAQSVASLLNPSQTLTVLDQSTSVVGIAVMSAEAASAGAATLLNFAAAISFSLGFMNLLPIPPLDGGKLLIEIVQAVIRRPVPLKVQNGLSVVGLALIGVLFVYMLRIDFMRFF